MRARIPALIAALALPGAVRGQFENPQDKILEITKAVAEEMQEIDKLLLQSTPRDTGQAATAMKRNVERIDALLKQTAKSQNNVVKNIDELIKQLEKMKGNGT